MERFPPDRRLQACMAVVLLLDALLTVALVGGLLALTVLTDRGWTVTAFALLLAFVGASAAKRDVRARHRGRDVTPADRRRVAAAAERLCVVGDIEEPRVAVREHPQAQSWTVAVPWQSPRVFVTTGLLDLLDDRELAAVVAHELGHVVHHDALVMTIAAAPGEWVLRGLRDTWRKTRHDEPVRAWLGAPFGLVFAIPALPFALLARVLSRFRERAADEAAARLTGSPAAVSAALRALSGDLARIDLRAAAPAVLNILPRRPAHGIARLWATHPPLERRLAALERMEARLQAPV